MDQRVDVGEKKTTGPKRGPDRQVFVGGYVSEELAARVKALARAYGMSVNGLMVQLIQEKLRLAEPRPDATHNGKNSNEDERTVQHA